MLVSSTCTWEAVDVTKERSCPDGEMTGIEALTQTFWSDIVEQGVVEVRDCV
jgi:hypothetical protein